MEKWEKNVVLRIDILGKNRMQNSRMVFNRSKETDTGMPLCVCVCVFKNILHMIGWSYLSKKIVCNRKKIYISENSTTLFDITWLFPSNTAEGLHL